MSVATFCDNKQLCTMFFHRTFRHNLNSSRICVVDEETGVDLEYMRFSRKLTSNNMRIMLMSKNGENGHIGPLHRHSSQFCIASMWGHREPMKMSIIHEPKNVVCCQLSNVTNLKL